MFWEHDRSTIFFSPGYLYARSYSGGRSPESLSFPVEIAHSSCDIMHEQSRASGFGTELVASGKAVVLISFSSKILKVSTLEHDDGAEFVGSYLLDSVAGG